MKQLVTQGIILSRTDFGEADRIITVLTPDHGKLRLMAKGVRRIKSKLAGGIELFSISQLTFIQGRGDMGTLISSRLERHYGQIAKDIQRTMLGYELIKQLNKATEDSPESDYFDLLQTTLASLDQPLIPLELIQIWFAAQLLQLAGHAPNLVSDTTGQKLASDQTYDFSYDDMTFAVHPSGQAKADDIKFLRLLFSGHTPQALAKISTIEMLASKHRQLLQFMVQQYIQ